MKTISRVLTFVLLSLLVTSGVAHAHVLPGDPLGFHHGFTHPFRGLDHMLAMIAVGLWAAQLGGRARWMVPISFVGVMALGAAIAMAGVHVPYVEQGIIASVMALGLLIALAARLPLPASIAVVALFALFHGHSHGTEMPVDAAGFAYGAGMMLATAMLHASGIGIAFAVRSVKMPVVRWAGAAIAVAGVVLALA